MVYIESVTTQAYKIICTTNYKRKKKKKSVYYIIGKLVSNGTRKKK